MFGYVYIYGYICVDVCVCMYVYVWSVCMYMCVHLCKCVCIHVHVWVGVDVCVHVCMYVYICLYMCSYVNVCACLTDDHFLLLLKHNWKKSTFIEIYLTNKIIRYLKKDMPFFFFYFCGEGSFILFVVLWASWICGVVSNINLGEVLSHYCFNIFCFFFLLIFS